MNRITMLCALSAVSLGALVGPSVASAKTYSVSLKFVGGPQRGDNISAKVSGKPLGSCTMKGKLVIPKTNQTWKCKGGTIKIVGTGTTGAADNSKGTWKATGGTGKFKGIKGSGSFAGRLSTAKFTYKGKLTY
jgi:hypothetical protein